MKIFIFTSLFFYTSSLIASSCCGGGSSSSMIILGDNTSEWNFAMSSRRDFGQTDEQGYSSLNPDSISDQQFALSIGYSLLAAEQFQIGFKTSIVQKNIEKQNREQSQTGLGDIDLQASYEILPEFTYSPLKPRGFIFAKVGIPQSPSLYNSTSPIFSDVRGIGLYSTSIGGLLVKRNSGFTFKLGSEFQKVFGKKFANLTLDSYYRTLIPFALSFSHETSGLTFGVSSNWNYQTAKQLTGSINSTSHSEYFWEFSTFINYSIDREQGAGLSYSDSSLIGKSINSSLYRTIAVSYTHMLPL